MKYLSWVLTLLLACNAPDNGSDKELRTETSAEAPCGLWPQSPQAASIHSDIGIPEMHDPRYRDAALRFITEQLPTPLGAPLKLLSLGAGLGLIETELHQLSHVDVTAVDCEIIAQTDETQSRPPVFLARNVLVDDFETEVFDLIFIKDLLGAVYDFVSPTLGRMEVASKLKRFAAWLKPGGLIIVANDAHADPDVVIARRSEEGFKDHYLLGEDYLRTKTAWAGASYVTHSTFSYWANGKSFKRHIVVTRKALEETP